VAYTQFFLDHGVGVNRVNSNNETALHIAVEHDRVELVQCLLNQGVNPNIQSEDQNETALAVAKRHGRTEILNLLEGKP